MFGTLIESRSRARARAGGTAVSVALHAGIITAATLGGARAVPARSAPPPVIPVTFHPFPERAPVATPHRHAPPMVDPDPAPRAATWHIATPDAVPSVPTIAVPQATSAAVAAASGGAATNFRSIIGDVRAGGAGDDSPGTPWTGSELLMHIVKRVMPRYPAALRDAGIDGDVLVRFVVDTAGRIDVRSIDVLESTNDLFTQSVRSALSGFRFTPSIVRGHKVPSVAEMPFQFVVR